MRHLVITADDGFYAETRDRGIVRCLEVPDAGVSDVSVLMNGAVARSLSRLPQILRSENSSLYSVFSSRNLVPGLHINLTEGVPLSPSIKVPTLLNSNGCFLGKFDLRDRVSAGDVDLNQVELEVDRQLHAYRSLFSVAPLHVDGHQHVHVLPALLPVFSRLLPRHGVEWIRVPQEHEGNFACASYLEPGALQFYREVSFQASEARACFTSSGLKCTDAFIGMTLMGQNQTLDAISSCLCRLPADCSVEFMTHPGYRVRSGSQSIDEPLDGCGDPTGPDEFACSADREHEMHVLVSAATRTVYERTGCLLVSFRDLSLR